MCLLSVRRILDAIYVAGFGCIFLLQPTAFGQTAAACNATKDQPVKVCFDEKALSVDHCKKEIQLHFHVARLPFDNGIQPAYYFTYQLLPKDGDPLDLQNPFNSSYILTDDDPVPQGKKYVRIPFVKADNFAVRVTVYAEGRDPKSEDSTAIPLHDTTSVGAVIAGVSNYKLASVPTLFHADSDARSFDMFLSSLFPPNSGKILTKTLLTTSDDQNNPTPGSSQPTPQNIMKAIAAEEQDPQLCSNDDWFIFYFSGHGVIGSNANLVGDNDPLTRHYISTTLLDPANLSTTAIPIEDIVDEIRKVPAGNKLVVIDSCFAGSSTNVPMFTRSQRATKTVPHKTTSIRHASKVAYVYGDEFVDPFQIDTTANARRSGDLRAFHDVPEREEADNRRTLYLAAAFADHEAEEGFAQYSGDNLNFLPSDQESDVQKPMGHSLYTFAFLWNLIVQLPIHSNIPAILNGAQPSPIAVHPCSIDFLAGHDGGAHDIYKLSLKSKDRPYQKPDVAGHTDTALPPLECEIAPQDDAKPN